MSKRVSASANVQFNGWEGSTRLVSLFWLLPKEIYWGVKSGSIPFSTCFNTSAIFSLFLANGWDFHIFRSLGVSYLHPSHPCLFWLYWATVSTGGFWAWAISRAIVRQKMLKRLTDVFLAAGLKNPLGNLPSLVFDKPIDKYTRKLRVTRATFPKSAFEKAIPHLESALQVYIDEIKENRVKNTVDIFYSHLPMPEEVTFKSEEELFSGRFFVGRTRARRIIEKLADVPHLLVAGQTKGGKSTFLRQFITSLYLNNANYQFTLVDLKGGLEFQTFENLERVEVISSVTEAIDALTDLEVTLESRKRLLKDNKVKDIEAFFKKPKEKRIYPKTPKGTSSLSRYITVIDEAFDLFMVGAFADARQVQKARRLASKIAAQGRAVGIHLVIATQRPDRNALDPQTKANLIGKLCFQMSNSASSMTVLDRGRASELPPVPGRAIWQQGSEMVEVQAPLMTEKEADSLLEKYRTKIEKSYDVKPSNEEDIHK